MIKNETSADIALLWADPENYKLYRRSGWDNMPELAILSGNPTNPNRDDDGSGMVLFCSEHGENARTALEHGDLYLKTGKW